MNRIHLARAAHEINRAYCAALGDTSQLPWESAPKWQKDSALMGVDMHLANPDSTPEDSHVNWLAQKTADGWKFGPVKDAKLKEHPCFLPYAELPTEQKAKDYLFRAVVHTLKDMPDAAIAALPSATSADGTLTSVKYIGARLEYTDGTYGTGIHWVQGQSHMVPTAAARLLLKHKDVYAPGDVNAPVAVLESKLKADTEDDKQDVRDSIANMDKDAIGVFAKTHFNVDIEKRKSIATLREQVTGMFDQFGL
jgi:hypothetical protein